MFKRLRSHRKTSSRSQIDIKEVRDNVLVLPNGYYAAVIQTSSVNFELKSEEEQDVMIERYSHFLNSLTTSMQMLVRLWELDISEYIDSVLQKSHQEQSQVYRMQSEAYCEFLRTLVVGNKIMTRRSYVIVPYKAPVLQDFSLVKDQINLNSDIVIKGLEKMNMRADILSGLEILELFYEVYNPRTHKAQQLQSVMGERLTQNIYAI